MKQLIDDLENALLLFMVLVFPFFFLFQNTWRSYEYRMELERRGVTVKARILDSNNINGGKGAFPIYYVYTYNGHEDTGSFSSSCTRWFDWDIDSFAIAYEKPIVDVVFLPEQKGREVLKMDLFYFPNVTTDFLPFFTGNSFWLTVLAICFIIFMPYGLNELKKEREKNGSIPLSSD